jgi:hypothetical protein
MMVMLEYAERDGEGLGIVGLDSELTQLAAPRKLYHVAMKDISLQNMEYAILKVCGN